MWEHLWPSTSYNLLPTSVRTALDSQTLDEPLAEGSQHGIAEQLLIFLTVLPERIIPQKYYKQIVLSSDTPESAAEALNELPSVHKACFLRLIKTLKKLLDNQKFNSLSEDFISTLFNSLLFVPPEAMPGNLKIFTVFQTNIFDFW